MNLMMQLLSGQSLTNSCQHKDNTQTRMKRDQADLLKLHEYVKEREIFDADSKELRNVVNGLVASPQVNVDHYRAVGQKLVDKMVGNNVFTIYFTRKSKAVNMDAMKSVKIGDERSPGLLFQGFETTGLLIQACCFRGF